MRNRRERERGALDKKYLRGIINQMVIVERFCFRKKDGNITSNIENYNIMNVVIGVGILSINSMFSSCYF